MKKRVVTFLLLCGVVAAGLISCGDSTGNDQGVSFTNLGWFSDAGTTGLTGFVTQLSETSSEVGGELPEVLGFLGLQNHLSNQSIRVQRVHHTYTVPGSSLSVPSTSVAYSSILAPSAATDFFNSDSSLPESHATGSTSSYGQIPAVTAAIRSFLNLNRSQLPELPFVMVITSQAVGITSAGHSITSNPVQTEVIFTEDTPIAPTDGTA